MAIEVTYNPNLWTLESSVVLLKWQELCVSILPHDAAGMDAVSAYLPWQDYLRLASNLRYGVWHLTQARYVLWAD